ncbi:hypothetical protein Belba_0798 [Belliella baltica DSM 15883]|uniref:Uncharacterized protein n=1 Tax=Belliella baltica (strain DSM 15883 / CIP 108006 / LMG 21964 / BA134) TaxID=866536 RepID=I3Z2H8_BELBD|nr:hypothetical protein Belba_0798 [Belliella baltica DSM 15883]
MLFLKKQTEFNIQLNSIAKKTSVLAEGSVFQQLSLILMLRFC